jgi:hypothetical protein
MDGIIVPIKNSPYIKTNIINNIKINVNIMILFQSVSLIVNLFHNKQLIDNAYLELTGDDYTNWGNDDQYIIDYVLNKLNFTQLDSNSNTKSSNIIVQ